MPRSTNSMIHDESYPARSMLVKAVFIPSHLQAARNICIKGRSHRRDQHGPDPRN